MKNKEFNALKEEDLNLVAGGAVVEVSVIQGYDHKVVEIPNAKWYEKKWGIKRSDGKLVKRCWTHSGAVSDTIDLTRDSFLQQDTRFEKYNEMVRRDIIT